MENVCYNHSGTGSKVNRLNGSTSKCVNPRNNGRFTDLLTGEEYDGSIDLGVYRVIIIKRCLK